MNNTVELKNLQLTDEREENVESQPKEVLV